MLAIEHEEYSILISETFGQAAGKLNLSERIRRVNNEQSLCIFSYCYYIFVVNLLCMVSGCFQMKCFYNITDVIVNAMLNSSLKHCKYEFAMFSFIV
ncbi:hypothetical protein T4A_3556 [Trichinella pseudospiralis]|nr:hypothetical protein T4A_3050 [Trichinella pseudospiralis]KRY64162.1 hypothetical protein T4A_1249 [Trichinella pseudospiralis]KRY66628.1 hypothetical protein T4A_3556 [Trichinella pseudospiralis]